MLYNNYQKTIDEIQRMVASCILRDQNTLLTNREGLFCDTDGHYFAKNGGVAASLPHFGMFYNNILYYVQREDSQRLTALLKV